jgi:MinD-like ATPase involved in chromosome partitioning or flagellar assembly
MSGGPAPMLGRRRAQSVPLIDGRPTPNGTGGRLRRRMQRLLVTGSEREEATLEQRLRTCPGVTRPNTIALMSPKGGVGKTTATFLIGNLLATHLRLRVVAIDANPGFGTLAGLVPHGRHSDRSLADLLEDADRLNTAAELTPYVARLATGLHVLGAPHDRELTGGLAVDRYGELLAFLATFYEVVLLDLGTGVIVPLARFATERADQLVLVTTPEWNTFGVALDALARLRHEHATVAINKSLVPAHGEHVLEDRFRAEHLHRVVTIPQDEQLAGMLVSGTYTLGALRPRPRVAVKRLGLAVAEQLA